MAGNENFFQHTKETNIIHKPQTTRRQLYVKYTTRKLKKFPTDIKNEKGTYREKERKKLLTFSHVFRKRQKYLFEVGAERDDGEHRNPVMRRLFPEVRFRFR